MIRRFNYTDRQRIPRENIRLAWVHPASGPLSFAGSINFACDKPLDPSALVFIEAYVGSQVMRFSCGTVSAFALPEDTRLHDFEPGLKPNFRVRIVSATPERRLVAWANELSPLEPEEVQSGERSILPVEAVDLGPLVWNLRIDANQFRLQLNSRIREPRDITSMAKEPDFVALVYPAVIRHILQHLLLGPERDAVEPDHDWLVFSSRLAGRPAPERNSDDSSEEEVYADDANEWIDEVVAAFSHRNDSVAAFMRARKDHEEFYV